MYMKRVLRVGRFDMLQYSVEKKKARRSASYASREFAR
jgi:hypothetical protein